MRHCVLKYELPIPEDPTKLTTCIEAPIDFNPLSVVVQNVPTIVTNEAGDACGTRPKPTMFVHGICYVRDDDEVQKCRHAFLIVPNGADFSGYSVRFLNTIVLDNRIPVLTFHVFYQNRGR